jgi:hypothetical protein
VGSHRRMSVVLSMERESGAILKLSPGVRREGFCRLVSDRARHSALGSCYGYSEGGEL